MSWTVTGTQVSQGSPLLTVIDSERLQVLTQVDESDLYLLREGMPVLITGEGFSGQILSGKISTVAVQSNTVSSPDSSSRYDVVVSVNFRQYQNTQMIRLGMSARVAVILYKNEHGIAVPPNPCIRVKMAPSGLTTALYWISLSPGLMLFPGRL
ncbi:HlyD family efflux transporter periplasmic adaptor subunit [Kosakonia sp. MUSA4]|uniref:HlyD family efflux transporter periplasmic adaptor subunit n=1 Tax=Kosakonia sp. MUSA4 TaxID=2067958 RepID=UPI00159A4BC6|nr:HlyD family efflux transporter periplasmic adaptor subunit [Kosakonia sp. MUSA4]QJT82325.1 hypothetical protein C0557_20720 [Kosakonia sp. MUSA4]